MSATNVARGGKRGNICVGNNVSATLCPRRAFRPWQTRTHRCGHIVAHDVSWAAQTGNGNICCGHKMFQNKIRNIFCVPDTKFVSATNVARAGKWGNICVGNNVSPTMCPRLPGPFNFAYSGTHDTFLYSGKISEAFVHYTFISPLKCCTTMLNFFLGFRNARFPQKLSLKCFVNVHTLGFLCFNLSTLLTVQSA